MHIFSRLYIAMKSFFNCQAQEWLREERRRAGKLGWNAEDSEGFRRIARCGDFEIGFLNWQIVWWWTMNFDVHSLRRSWVSPSNGSNSKKLWCKMICLWCILAIICTIFAYNSNFNCVKFCFVVSLFWLHAPAFLILFESTQRFNFALPFAAAAPVFGRRRGHAPRATFHVD